MISIIKTERNYAIDLLRILSMFMIVMLHSGSHGRTLFISEGLNFYTIWFHFIEALSICSVDVFVLISGYFLCTQKFKLSRIIKMAFAVIFYSVAWYLMTIYVFHEPLAKKELIRAVLPISYNQYWFISAYIGMYLLSPVLNVLIRNLKQKQHIGTIALLVAMFSLWPDVLPFSSPLGITPKGYTVVWFVVLYIIATYFQKYPVKMKPSKAFRNYVISALALLLIWMATAIVTKADSFENELHGQLTFYYYRYNSMVVLATALFLWILFLNIRVENKFAQKVISFIAPLTMGVYLIHDNEKARDFVWQGLKSMEPSMAAPVITIGYVIMVFIVCLTIDKVRLLLFTIINKRDWYKAAMKRVDEWPSRVNSFIYAKTTKLLYYVNSSIKTEVRD